MTFTAKELETLLWALAAYKEIVLPTPDVRELATRIQEWKAKLERKSERA